MPCYLYNVHARMRGDIIKRSDSITLTISAIIKHKNADESAHTCILCKSYYKPLIIAEKNW